MVGSPESAVTRFQRVDAVPPHADRRVQSLLDFWQRHCVGGQRPTRVAFDALNLKTWLGYLSIFQFVPELDDFVNRLEGVHIVAMTGEDWTWRRARDIDNRFNSTFRDELIQARDHGRPLIHLVQVFQVQYVNATRMLLPVSVAGEGSPDQVFMAMFPDPVRR